MLVRLAPFLCCITLTVATYVSAQTAPPPEGFGPPPASDLLAQRPQSPGAVGDQQRHYYFKDAGREMPYRLYVPKSYSRQVKTPLVVALHGFGGNHDYFFGVVPGFSKLIEQHGFIVVSPMGYSVGGWYGAPLSVPGDRLRDVLAAEGRTPPPPPSGPQPSAEEVKRERDLSERDVMHVIDLVKAEYNIDPDRVYLMGHSMGGLGTYFLGQKYAGTWAAIAPMSGTMSDYDYSLERLRKTPILVSAGSTEILTTRLASQQVQMMRKMGMTADYVEIAGGTHMSMIAPTVPQVFAFFSKHARKR
jgi:poly(3-hydroxybutyrate) depolymerase